MLIVTVHARVWPLKRAANQIETGHRLIGPRQVIASSDPDWSAEPGLERIAAGGFDPHPARSRKGSVDWEQFSNVLGGWRSFGPDRDVSRFDLIESVFNKDERALHTRGCLSQDIA